MHKNTQIAVFTILLAHVSGAQAQSTTVEEVIVTATKQAQSLQDIPVTVNALSENTIQEAGVVNANDIAALVPSLTVSSNISPFATGIRIRGFGTSQNDPALEASVAFILDGVYMGRSGLGMSDLVDVERIEVLQGPQGTLYGKNSNAGVVSIITKQPDTGEYEGFIEATTGNYALRKLVGSVNLPISDSMAYRFSGSWHEHDGWLENNTGDDLNAVKDWNLRGKMYWTDHDSLDITLSAATVERDTTCCGADALQTTSITDELRAQDLPVPKNDAFDYENDVDTESDFELSSDMISLEINYDLDSAELTSLTAWNTYDYTTSLDAERSALSVLWVEDDEYTGDFWSQELRIAAEASSKLQYLAGVFYSLEEITRGRSDTAEIFLGSDIITVAGAESGLGDIAGLGVQPGDSVSFDNKWESETTAIFGQMTYDLSKDWIATLGLRYTRESKDARLKTVPFSTAALFGTGQTLVEQAYAAIDDKLDRDNDDVTGIVSITHYINAETMVFASVSTGSKSGGFNGVAGNEAPREFDDEESTNYELGIKTQLFDNRLILNATAFHTEFENLQFLAQQPGGVGFFVSNAAEGASSGLDMSFNASPWAFLALSGGIQYLDARYTEGLLDDAGLDVAFAAKWSGNLAATFYLPLAEGTGYFRSDYSYLGDHFTNPTYQDPKTEQDKSLLNLRLGWRDDSWDFAVWVKNATDDDYASVIAEPLAFAGTEAYFLEAPRTYGASLSYTF